jgi:Immunity protein Imm1
MQALRTRQRDANMTVTEPYGVLRREELDITEFADAEVLVASLREANVYRSKNPDAGLVWIFMNGEDPDAETLFVGVRDEVGSLVWCHGQDGFLPENGLNADWAGYWTWFGHDTPMDPGSEVPIEQVYAALTEFVTTRQRPTCIAWRPHGRLTPSSDS